MDLKQFLNAFKAKNQSSKELRFGLMYYHNDPEKKALLVMNNRDALFTDVSVNVIDTAKQIFHKKIERIEARVAMYIGYNELLDNNQKPFDGIIKEVQIQHSSKHFLFIPKENGFVCISSD